MMCDQPYTTADEDPFNVQPYFDETRTLRTRRSSMLTKWISEQHAQSSDDTQPKVLQLPELDLTLFPSFASASNPYLAYPELAHVRVCANLTTGTTSEADQTDAASIASYDLVEDDDIPSTPFEAPEQEDPVTPIPTRTHKSSRSSITPSFRAINLGFRSSSPVVPSSPNMEAASRAFARLSFFPRTPRSSTGPSSETDPATPPQHARSSSLASTTTSSASHQATKLPPSSPPSKWRPTVLGHFNQPSISQVSIGGSDAHYTPSRPSISSGETYATSTTSRTTFDTHIPSTPSKLSLFDSIRLRNNKSPKSPKSASTFSIASTSSVRLSSPTAPTIPELSFNSASYSKASGPHQRVPLSPRSNSVLDNIDDEEDLDPPPTYRFNQHAATRPTASYTPSGTLSRVKFASLNSRSQRKKKKLVISGIGVTENRKFEGIKRWCESFGEIRQINRMPNGDLQIDFRDPEVADTVCRVRAKVFIAGVGSVQLSWVAGNKR